MNRVLKQIIHEAAPRANAAVAEARLREQYGDRYIWQTFCKFHREATQAVTFDPSELRALCCDYGLEDAFDAEQDRIAAMPAPVVFRITEEDIANRQAKREAMLDAYRLGGVEITEDLELYVMFLTHEVGHNPIPWGAAQ